MIDGFMINGAIKHQKTEMTSELFQNTFDLCQFKIRGYFADFVVLEVKKIEVIKTI